MSASNPFVSSGVMLASDLRQRRGNLLGCEWDLDEDSRECDQSRAGGNLDEDIEKDIDFYMPNNSAQFGHISKNFGRQESVQVQEVS
jgi:hypothetical protein